MRRELHRSSGTTMIELVVALVIAGIVTTLGFYVYTSITTSFRKQRITAATIREAVLVKKRIDAACSRLSAVKQCTDVDVSGCTSTSDSMITIRLRNNTLYCESDTIVSGLSSWKFTLIRNDRDANAVLLWSGNVLRSGQWIGGAATVEYQAR